MTKLLEQALEVVRALPPEAQHEVARVMLSLVADEGPEKIVPAHLPDAEEPRPAVNLPRMQKSKPPFTVSKGEAIGWSPRR